MTARDRHNTTTMKNRLRRWFAAGFFIMAVVAGQLILHHYGMGIPCFFRAVTGLQCPGCGVTHMAAALLRGDVRGAFEANAGVMVILVPLGVVLLKQCVGYIRHGRTRMSRIENGILAVMAVILFAFAVLRNIGR